MPWEQPDVAGLRGESSSKFNRDPKDIVPPKPKESHSYSTIKPGEKQQTLQVCSKSERSSFRSSYGFLLISIVPCVKKCLHKRPGLKHPWGKSHIPMEPSFGLL